MNTIDNRPIDIDDLTARITAFDSFADLVNSHPSYRPTLLARDGADTIALADAYDAHMESVGDERRAWRGTYTPPAGGITLSVRLTSFCPHGKLSNTCCGYPEWLQVVHQVNALRPESFRAPLKSYDWWAGGWAEEYPDFRIILKHDENTNYVQAKTPATADVLRAAVRRVTGRLVDDHGMTISIDRSDAEVQP